MLIPKYKLNQEIWTITTDFENITENVKCDICNSTGVVELKGIEYTCPNCRGDKKHIRHDFRYEIDTHGKIGRIITSEYSEDYKEYGDYIQYMLDTTGVGSGTLHYEYRCFPSREEALEFIEKHKPPKAMYDRDIENEYVYLRQ